jgi:hypothetical protein
VERIADYSTQLLHELFPWNWGHIRQATVAVTMVAISMVFTAGYAAKRFGVDIDVIDELVAQMTSEDGCLSMDDAPEATNRPHRLR